MPVTINGTTGIAGPDGSASTPAVQGTDSNTGLFFPAADTVAITTGGTQRVTVDSSGNVGIGGAAATGCTLDVQGTSALKMPVGTTAQRPSSPVNGMTRMNTNTGQPEWYDATTSSWVSFNGSPTTSYGVEYLIVGGGGGGDGGGGGAGGLIQGVVSVSPGVTYRATVGGGGAGGSSRGNDSSFTTLSAIGGGGGQGYSSTSDGGTVNGGSGGGAASVGTLRPAGVGITGQGNNGGTTSSGGGGGGGGASAAGSSGSTAGGAGGNGTASSISGSSVTYAGGGGGGGSSSGGAGGTGGGGAGSSGTGNPGTANRGGGGGGGYAGPGNAGGSGVVIIRYRGSQRGTGGTVTTSDGYTIHTFNSSAFYVG